MSDKASSQMLSRCSPRATAVVTSFAVYAIGRPICSVISLASSSCLLLMMSSAFLTYAFLSSSDVFLYDLKASADLVAKSLSSLSLSPLRSTMPLLVMGEMVVIVSAMIVCSSQYRRRECVEEENRSFESLRNRPLSPYLLSPYRLIVAMFCVINVRAFSASNKGLRHHKTHRDTRHIALRKDGTVVFRKDVE